MPSIMQKLIANNFSDLAGLNVSGTIPFRQDLINEALAELIQSRSGPQVPKPAGLDTAQLLKLVKKAQVRAEQGVLTLEFEIKV